MLAVELSSACGFYFARARSRPPLRRAGQVCVGPAASPPSLLLHPLDLIGADDLPAGSGLEFFPGMALPGARKRRLVVDCLKLFKARYDVGPMGRHVDTIVAAGALPSRRPTFA